MEIRRIRVLWGMHWISATPNRTGRTGDVLSTKWLGKVGMEWLGAKKAFLYYDTSNFSLSVSAYALATRK
jgi:hypothetical protein